jgi:two-component system LytT family sensor kinase
MRGRRLNSIISRHGPGGAEHSPISVERDPQSHSRRLRFRFDPSALSRGQLAILIIAIWTALGLFQSVPELLLNLSMDVFLAKLIDAWTWALLTPAILLIDKRLTGFENNAIALIALFLGLSIVFSLIHLYITGILLYLIPGAWWSPLRNSEYIVYYFLGGWMTYWAIVGILLAFKFYNRSLTSQFALQRAEKRLLESHLNALRLQLEPHFLFNTLNAISSEVEENPGLVREMIEDLAVLLRRSLDYKDSAEITLAQEMALLDHYLAIQKVRFGDRIDFEIDVAPEVLPNLVPSLLLQPLVENAIRHGIEGRLSGGKIAISAHAVGAEVEIRVLDDGVGLSSDWHIRATRGVGVRATHERLEALYPEVEDHFAILSREGGGAEVVIRVPRHTAGKDSDDAAIA